MSEYPLKEPSKLKLFFIATGSLMLILLIGLLRILTGTEYALSLLFFLPILTSCWYINARAGYFMAFFSGIIWLLADLTFIADFSYKITPIINETFRLIVFLAGVYLLSGLRKALFREKLIAMTDPLTGVFNRRAFEKMANLELDRFRRYSIPFTVIFFDIDNFKAINDNFGHHTGDRLLKCVAQTVKDNIRSIDIFSRLGGDEFILILSGANKDLANAGVQKIRKVLQNSMSANEWSVTFSIGVVVFLTPPEDLNQVFSIADEAMYTAKKNGKNQDNYQEFAG